MFSWVWEVMGEADVTESSNQATVGKGYQADHVTAGISDSPLVSLDSSMPGPWLPAETPSVNPGLVPRELSGIQVLSEDMGTGLEGG